MNRKLIIILCAAVAAVAIILGICFAVSSRGSSSDTDWTNLENDSPYEVSWKNDSKGNMLLRLKGDFESRTFTVDEGSSGAVSITLNSSKKGISIYTLQGLHTGARSFIIGTKTDSVSEKINLSVYFDGSTVTPAGISYSSAETQVFTGDLDGYAYSVVNDGEQITLCITNGSSIGFENLSEDGNLFTCSYVLDTEVGKSEKDSNIAELTVIYDATNIDEKPEESISEKSETTDKETPSDVIFAFTPKTNGYDLIKVGSDELSNYLMIGASVNGSGHITIKAVEILEGNVIIADTAGLDDYFVTLYEAAVGEGMVPSDIMITGSKIIRDPESEKALKERLTFEVNEDGEFVVPETTVIDDAYSIGVLDILLYSSEWNYAVTEDMDTDRLVSIIDSSAGKTATGTLSEIDYQIFEGSNGACAAFTYNGKACLVYGNEEADAEAAVQAADAIIRALENN